MEGYLLPNAPPLHKPLSKMAMSGSKYNISVHYFILDELRFFHHKEGNPVGEYEKNDLMIGNITFKRNGWPWPFLDFVN